jgi:dethiobiotin synthetase
MFHVKQSDRRRRKIDPEHPRQSLFAFPEPISPHLAARKAGTRIDLGAIERWVKTHEAPITVVETAGGLFSPLGHGVTNFELTRSLQPDAIILVALDRLGVLHELTTTLALAAARGGSSLGVVLSTPAKKDASTGRNAPEIALLGIARPIAVFPRAGAHAPATEDAARQVIDWIEQNVKR